MTQASFHGHACPPCVTKVSRTGLFGVLLLGMMVWAALSVSPAPAREWTDTTGNFHVEAELLVVKDGKAYLQKSDEKVIGVPLTQLSKQDLRHLVSLSEYRDYFKTHPVPGMDIPEDNTPVRKVADKPDKPGKPKQLAAIHVEDESAVGEVRRFRDLNWGVASLAFSPDGRFLAVGKADDAILMFDVDKSERVAFIEKLKELGQVTSLAFSPDGTQLLSGGYSGLVQIWDVASDGSLTKANRFTGHSKAVRTITVSDDGTRVLSGGAEELVRCWSLADAREQFNIDGFSGTVKATFITRGGKQGLACDGDLLILIDMKSGESIQTMELGVRSAQAVALAPDGSRVVAQRSYALHSWEIRTGKGEPLFQDTEIQWFAAFLPNSRYLLSGGLGKVNLWDVEQHHKIYEFDTAGQTYVQMIACSPDNRHFAAVPGSARQDIQVFRLPAEVSGK